MLPSLGAESLDGWKIEMTGVVGGVVTLEVEGGVDYVGVLEDTDRGEAVGAAAAGKGCVGEGDADVGRDGGIEAEGFGDGVL